MSVDKVEAMLKSLRLGDHCAAFQIEALDGVLLAMLDEPALAEFGLYRDTIWTWVYNRKYDIVFVEVIVAEAEPDSEDWKLGAIV